MKKAAPGTVFLLLLSVAFLGGQTQSEPPPVEDLISHITSSLENKDLESYLSVFGPGIRDRERGQINAYFANFGMDTVNMQLAGRTTQPDGQSRLFFQVYFQNSFSAMIDNWQFTAALGDGSWVITGKEASGNPRTLYKVKIPAERYERAASVEITHKDIRLSFKNPAVFYDNIPGLETAFVLIGKGQVVFTPSDPIEQHQLELLYKKKQLDGELNFLFVRCSNSFFSSNVIIEGEGDPKSVSESDKSKAASVFAASYSRSFTIHSPVGDELISFLPQSDEAVFEFKVKRAGDLTYVFHPFSDEEVNLFDRGKDRVISLYHPDEGKEKGLRDLFISFEEKYDIDAYDVEVGYSPGPTYLTGKARIRVIPEIDGFDSIKFRFSSSLQILKIVDEEQRDLFFTQDKLRNLLYVYFITPPTKGTPVTLDVTYRGKISPPIPSTDIISQVKTQDGTIVYTPRYETFFFTQNAFWYPAPPKEDYFTFRMKIVVPPEYNCVASGQFIERARWEGLGDLAEIEKAGSNIFLFGSDRPVKYMSFIVGRFDRQREAVNPLPIQTFISSEVMSVSQNLFENTRDILEYYISSYGPYPYDKLGIVLRTWPTTGGHSPPSFIVLNEMRWGGVMDFPLRLDTPVSLFNWEEYFLAHEIAHQWWGHGVSIATYRDQWLSEGLAQFAAASYLFKKHGERAKIDILKKFSRWAEKKSVKGPINLGARLSYYDYEAFQAVVYNKAALVLLMLQDIIGEETFFEGLREFFRAYKFRAARTANFIKVMEDVSGRDLGNFFQNWIYSYELPEVRTAVTSEKTGDGFLLKLRVSQGQRRFEFPLRIAWTSGAVREERVIVVTDSVQDFVLPSPEKPENVRINPLRAVPGKFY